MKFPTLLIQFYLKSLMKFHIKQSNNLINQKQVYIQWNIIFYKIIMVGVNLNPDTVINIINPTHAKIMRLF